MVSEPNLVLGIKQTSLHSKEDSHVHTTMALCCVKIQQNKQAVT